MLIDATTGVIVQGITGHHGSFHTSLMLKYGTKIVAGVTPGKGGMTAHGVPVFNSVKQAMDIKTTDGQTARWSIIFVPAAHALSASLEALEAGLNLVIITENIPVHDTLKIFHEARRKNLLVIGPNCPGIIVPGESKIGIMPGEIFAPGKLGVLSRSGTLTYEIVSHLTQDGVGQSTVIGIGGDMISGLNYNEGLELFEKDNNTDSILLIGEIGGDAEERAADFIKDNVTKPVFAFLAGRTAPEGKTMGHAGAIISGLTGTYISKKNALENAGVKIADFPHEVSGLISENRN
ncbi:succinate--CoA ligase subunit alpha [Patescibacteria group bacterium]|nr:succinate--CoA ligase subunit alpha [Patescibacteria group bacterium]MBU1703414.1 succinate--CoA ligase subunit alpha [Patescibacteria group bacterium]MBU1953865.1 succinate--CoA ligase subunit alpha [Patescibacteria group bacterium]